MPGGVERYRISKTSEKKFKHDMINVIISKTNIRLSKEMPKLLEKTVYGIGKGFQYWNKVFFKETAVNPNIHLIEYTRFDSVKWYLKVQGFCHCLKQQKQDEYYLGWEWKRNDLPLRTFQLHKIGSSQVIDVVSRKLSRIESGSVHIWKVQPDARCIAGDIALFMYGVPLTGSS